MSVPKINFASPKLAFILIALVLAHLILSAVIPQSDFAEERLIDWQRLLGDKYDIIDKLALNRIYSAPPFFALLALLAINLIAGNVKRYRAVYKSGQPLLKARHLGSMVFHLSLVLIMLSIILNYAFKFDGVFSITEGQTVTDSEHEYHRIIKGPFYSDEYERFRLRLDKLEYVDSIQSASFYSADVTVWGPYDTLPAVSSLQTNHPLQWGDIEFHYGLFNGYSPKVVLMDSTGNTLFDAFVRLATQKHDGENIYADFVELPALGLKIAIEVISKDRESPEPRFYISVEKDTTSPYIDTLGLGEGLQFEGFQIRTESLRRWCYINAVQSPFLGLLFFGFWLALAGMVISLVPRLIGNRRST